MYRYVSFAYNLHHEKRMNLSKQKYRLKIFCNIFLFLRLDRLDLGYTI